MKEAGDRFLTPGSLGRGACLAWDSRTKHMQFLSFAALVQAPSHPPSVVVDMDSDILEPVVYSCKVNL